MNELFETSANEGAKKATTSAIDLIIDTFVRPKIEAWKNKPKDYFELIDLISEYLKKSYNTTKYMNTIVFRKECKTVEDLYIPLTLVNNGNKKNKIVLDNNLTNIFESPSKRLVIDTAGMGKSTLVKFLSLLCVEKGYGVPFIIELRRIEKKQSVLSYMVEEMKLLEKNFSQSDIEDIIKRGDFIFFLDGYDEISEENKQNVTENMRKFVLESSNNSFVLTSREDELLGEFAGFEKLHIKPLEKEEAYKLIKKYDGEGTTSKDLIKILEENKNYDTLEEFLSNPLMVSLLYLSYQYKGVLHYKKHTFYRQVYDALFEKHDCIKGSGLIHEKHSKLDIDEFKQVLSVLGFLSIKRGQIEFDREEINYLLNSARDFYPNISMNTNDFFNDILHTVPLFVEEGIKYKWAHKSFAEYFAADFICFENKKEEAKTLENILFSENNPKYYNIIDFLYDMDYKAVLEHLIFPTIKKFVDEYDKKYLTSKFNFTDLDLISIRRFFEFIDEISFVKIENTQKTKKRKFKNEPLINDYVYAYGKYKEHGKEGFSYVSCESSTERIFLFIKRKSYFEVVKLIYRKNVDLFRFCKIPEFPMNIYKQMEIGVYDVNDLSTNLLNNEENFKAVTSCIYHSSYELRNTILDYDKCCKFISNFEKQKKDDNNSIFVLD